MISLVYSLLFLCKGDKFCESPSEKGSILKGNDLLSKGSTLKGKNLLPTGANSFLLE